MSDVEGMIRLICKNGIKVFVLRILEQNEYHFRGPLKARLTSHVQIGWELILLS